MAFTAIYMYNNTIMKPLYHINSPKNQHIKRDLRLKNRKARDENKLITVEGYNEFKFAYDAGVVIERLYICPDYLKPTEESFLQMIPQQRTLLVSPEVIQRLAYRQNPDAWFAVLRWNPLELQQIKPNLDRPQIYLIVEDLEKPGNIGAILRSADAAGAQAVIASKGRTDLRNPNVVRASRGTLFSFPTVEASNEETLAWLNMHQITIAVASPGAPNDPPSTANLWNIDLPSPLALVLGAENEGVSDFWKDAAEVTIRIPMLGTVNSLNVAQAGTIIIYEALRRHQSG